MSVQIVPTFADPFYQQVTSLDGSPFLLSFQFNVRAQCWYLSMSTEENEDIVNALGIKIVCNMPLLRKVADDRAPQGELFCFSSTTDTSPPGINDLLPNARCALVYFPAADLP